MIMESRPEFVSKLKHPTFGKSPSVVSSKVINSLNIAGSSNSSEKSAPLTGTLRRRSKSSSDLRAGTIIDKSLFNRHLPTIHAKKPLVVSNTQKQKCFASSSKTDLTSAVKERPGLRRRSKSVADINQLQNFERNVKKTEDKTVTKVPQTCAKNVRRIPNKIVNTGLKRTIPDNKSDEQPKPKVMKSARIPPYDYKARFQHLEGIHLKLKTNYETLRTSFNTYKEEQSDFINQHDVIKSRLEYLQTECENAHLEKKAVTSTNNELLKEVENVNEENAKYKSEIKNKDNAIQNKDNTIQKLQLDLNKITASYENLSKDHLELKESNKNIKLENEEWKSKNNELNLNILELKSELEHKDLIRQKLHNDVQDLKGNIRVFCRVRPSIPNEEKLFAILKYTDDTDIQIRRFTESISAITGKIAETKQEFSFDRVFDENSSQADIFDELSQLVQSALDGYNVCVFAYGQTGSGKTYTMQGYDADHEGMIPRSLRVIFNYGETKKNLGWSFAIQASFLEIYNETLNDLLNIKNKEHLEIFYNEGKGVSVKNLTIEPVETYTELRKLMTIAHKNRTVAATDFNLHSSRSHAVTQIHITATNSSSKVKLTSIINLVDLAGSESAKTSSQERLTETKSINKSLSTLGTVMNDLGAGKTHIPYRNSKLTFLLQSCLSGNSKTLMIVHISPNDECYNESINSLRFAAKVKSVKTMSKKNKTLV